MKVLLCCEYFFPSVGGVQKMIHEIGSGFIAKGHSVTVATSWIPERIEMVIDGIEIKSFKITGNSSTGLTGDIVAYQNFLIESRFDFLLVMAAQQWTLDAMLPILDQIPYKKLHIPCGYSGFYLKKYKHYYDEMHNYLRKFDHLIYNAIEYRDVNYARAYGLTNINYISAGASETEFLSNPKNINRNDYGLGKNDFIYLTVGAPAYQKGHKELLNAYLQASIPFPSAFIVNGNYANEICLSDLITSPKTVVKELLKIAIGQSTFNIKKLAKKNNDPNKKIIFADLERKKLISLFFEADLFLFASHVEYSPLVIFECLAAGLPFLSIPVGNVEEISDWSKGGVIVNGKISQKGFSIANIPAFSKEMVSIALDKNKRESLSKNGRKAWLENFTWKSVVGKIEDLVK